MKYLLIAIPQEGNDLEDTDLEVFLSQCKNANGLNLMVGRAAPGKLGDSGVSLNFTIGADTFTPTVLDSQDLLTRAEDWLRKRKFSNDQVVQYSRVKIDTLSIAEVMAMFFRSLIMKGRS